MWAWTPRRWGSCSLEYHRDYEPGPAQFQRVHAPDAERRLQVRPLARARRAQDTVRTDRTRAPGAFRAECASAVRKLEQEPRRIERSPGRIRKTQAPHR